MRSKRFEALAKRPVNQDGFVKEWIEEGFIAMESPNDPKPSIRIVNGAVTELDGKPVEQFDLIDHFIARYGINLARAEEVMAMDSVKLANMLCAVQRHRPAGGFTGWPPRRPHPVFAGRSHRAETGHAGPHLLCRNHFGIRYGTGVYRWR